MKKLWAAAGALVAAILFVAPSGAKTASPSGDTCSATGNGTAYSVSITIPATASEHGAFAFGAPGATITGIKIPGETGSFSTQNLPANTTATWVLANTTSVRPGNVVSASVTTNHSITGAFTLVPATAATNGAPMTYFDPVSCAIAKVTAPDSNQFTVSHHFTYSAGAWHFTVTVPVQGRVSVGSKSSPKSLLEPRTVPVSGAGKVKIALVPTTAGKARLAATGSIKATLVVEFSPKSGKPANKSFAVTLKK